MKKFINHVDHVVYLSRIENIEKNIAALSAITDANMAYSLRKNMDTALYIDFERGLEMVAPLATRTEANKALHDRLDSHGEGLLGIVYGVENLEAYKAKLEARGFEVGTLIEAHPDEPWFHRLVLRERFAPGVMNSWIVLSQIDYKDDVVRFVDVK